MLNIMNPAYQTLITNRFSHEPDVLLFYSNNGVNHVRTEI
jgi:hypothetical protein